MPKIGRTSRNGRSHRRQLPFTTDLTGLHEANPQRYPFLLETVTGRRAGGRYDILFADPGDAIELTATGLMVDGIPCPDPHFLTALDRHWATQGTISPADKLDDLPFTGGWFLYLSYELAAQVEPRLHAHESRDGWPVALAVRCTAAIVRDHLTHEVYAVTESEDDAALYSIAREARRYGQVAEKAGDPVSVVQLQEDAEAQFIQGVRRIKSYIRAGDVFQVNLSRGWHAHIPPPVSSFDIYRSLRKTNPAPFAGSAVWKEAALMSSSPERLVSQCGRRLEARPIAGTRPRALDAPELDVGLSSDLMGNLKERSEHIMLVDLERNDLGRISLSGSVRVDDLMTLESYAHVHHIVSGISGELRPGVTPGEIIAAMFPGGTITGAPKVRCMEIIAELEDVGRGAYTGSMGYLDNRGRLDLNILIRTMVKSEEGLRFRAGAGIVADSDPHAELAETRSKALGLLKALGRNG